MGLNYKTADIFWLGAIAGKNGYSSFNFEAINQLKKLARKHHRLAEMSCNGAGRINGKAYYAGLIDDYAKREYGSDVLSAYIDTGYEDTIFDLEAEKVATKINSLINTLNCSADTKKGRGKRHFRVEYQGDPRGNTVKVYFFDRYINLDLF